jgi:hypothetical protein
MALNYSTQYYRLRMWGPSMGSPRVFKTKWFQRFARKERIADATLLEAVVRAEKGQMVADLGGGVIKQRIARPGQGKSGGYRTIILFRKGERAVFMYGFAKSEQDNIDDDEEKQFKDAAKHVLALTEKQLMALVRKGDFVEVKYEQEL